LIDRDSHRLGGWINGVATVNCDRFSLHWVQYRRRLNLE
jgi:hypothetical protein